MNNVQNLGCMLTVTAYVLLPLVVGALFEASEVNIPFWYWVGVLVMIYGIGAVGVVYKYMEMTKVIE